MWESFTSPSTWAWFTEPFAGQNWWQILNAGFVGTAISSLVGIYVARSVVAVAQKDEVDNRAKRDAERDEGDARELVGAVDDDSERADGRDESVANASPTTPSSPRDELANQAFATASASIRRLKDYIDMLAERCRDGRTRRKYSNISRRDYRIITTAIAQDGGLSDSDRKKIFDAFELWRTYRNGRVPVPNDVVRKLQSLAMQFRVTATKPSRWKPEPVERPEAQIEKGPA